ncbi:MAG: tRNA lysidine(34) synthetase TilS, partial [Oscillospiraceae bacterium]|nr:tRNA lysidine(34) synthetase TilS [Oscillospiraceae bacterium]
MLEHAEALIREYGMFPPGCKVLCAVSGGADSVCLLHWLSQQKDISLMAAHFNHQLRGEESDRDQQFVRELCEKWHILLTVGQGDVASHAKKQGLSIEEAARNLRYAFLRETAEKNGCDFIATAHNADDNLETLLLNLTRGAGLQGLTGISPQQGVLVRPLLTTTRKEIEAYLRSYSLSHVEDGTNTDETYS